ncbi:WhiB family transcriptional regulator [Jatrophihabitans sp.]|uniref:WhiB family transcriptional regulator n=1 Tax=Jatrophihabitans sp. TaxID=1932789 RepID=UPI0030C70F5F|nr:WhiB family transcriptional regulator [Jatrophihabitans sp.]
MLTSCSVTDVLAEPTSGPLLAQALLGGTGSALGGLDPLAKECPDDVPCRVEDADLWFAETPAELEQAKAMCLACPARLACLAGAVERREPWGVWGGEIFERGAIVARKRPRGRPRKDDRTEVAA